MLLMWINDPAVLLWPWVVKDGIVLPPAERRRHKHRRDDKRDEDEGGYDHNAERARRDE